MVVLFALAVAGCGEEEAQRIPLGEDAAQSEDRRANWPEELTAQVDSANLEYSNAQYEAARERYAALTEQYPDISTVWFGLYMAESALGNDEAAAAALEKAESMAPGLGRMHDAAESGAMMGDPHQMPAGHPPLDSVDPEDAPPLGGG